MRIPFQGILEMEDRIVVVANPIGILTQGKVVEGILVAELFHLLLKGSRLSVVSALSVGEGQIRIGHHIVRIQA